MEHSAEFRRALVECDVRAIRRLWQHVSPHLPQPKDDAAALIAIHMARVKMTTLPAKLREYSEAWLSERRTGRIAHAVGIAVGFANETNPKKIARSIEIREAMSDAVERAVVAGVDLATETAEVRRRMMRARERTGAA